MVIVPGTEAEWRAPRRSGLLILALVLGLFGAIAAPAPLLGQTQAEEETATRPEAPIRRGPASWTSDRHALAIGDIVTILVDESTLATADVRDSRSLNRSRNLGIEGGYGDVSYGAGGTSRANMQDRTNGESVRRERFSTEISARVIEEGPGGVVRIEGEKRVRIDGHEQVIAISGWLRSADIGGRNTIESWRLADAEIRYGARGDMRRVRGIWGRLIGWLWP